MSKATKEGGQVPTTSLYLSAFSLLPRCEEVARGQFHGLEPVFKSTNSSPTSCCRCDHRQGLLKTISVTGNLLALPTRSCSKFVADFVLDFFSTNYDQAFVSCFQPSFICAACDADSSWHAQRYNKNAACILLHACLSIRYV